MARIRRLLPVAAVVVAGGLAAASPAPAAVDGTSNTMMSGLTSGPERSYALSFTAIEFKNTGLACAAFMDYTDDACVTFAPDAR
jgi:hypothetical protein